MNSKLFKNLFLLTFGISMVVMLIGWFFIHISQHQAQLIEPTLIEIKEIDGHHYEYQDISKHPKILQYSNSELRTHSIRLKLPSLSHQIFGLFSPQIIHGGEYYLNDQLIYTQPSSNSETRYAWYRPLWLQFPETYDHASHENFLEIRMHSYQRGFIVPSFFIAPWITGHHLYEIYDYITSTLVSATNLFSWLAGLFMLSIWITSDKSVESRLFAYAGGATFLWASLFTLALLPELNISYWIIWRFLLYLSTGGLVLLMSLFLFEYAKTYLSKIHKILLISLCIGPPFLFLAGGDRIELWLDLYWTAFIIFFYVIAIVNLIRNKFHKLDILTTILIGHSFIATIFAFHDYGVQSGPLLFHRDIFDQLGVPEILLEPIYLSHFTLPALLLIAGVILIRVHIRNLNHIKSSNSILEAALAKRENELHAIHETQQKITRDHAINSERNRILQDIHDGLGSKLIHIMLGLRTKTLSQETLILDIQSCLDDLRILVNGQFLDELSLSDVLKELCDRASYSLKNAGCTLVYEIDDVAVGQTESDQALAVLRITQEMLSNIIKHSHATEARIALQWADKRKQLRLVVSDNGVGFDSEDSHHLMKRGMKGIHQRLHTCTVYFEFLSRPGCTQLEAIIPTTLAHGSPSP